MVMMLTVMLLAGCGKKPVQLVQPESAGAGQEATVDLATFMQSTENESGEGESNSGSTTEDAAATSESTSAEPDEATAVTSADTAHIEPLLDEDGTYTSKVDVALYIHTYGKLPANFMTKKQAKKLGWSGGSLEDYAPGMCIGGDYFGNYEGLLPEDKEYHECDIDTLGKKSRGAKRIIYSDDGYIYYTEDHYESFELLYES
jgi:guanyl-specific ribonuclease Sa